MLFSTLVSLLLVATAMADTTTTTSKSDSTTKSATSGTDMTGTTAVSSETIPTGTDDYIAYTTTSSISSRTLFALSSTTSDPVSDASNSTSTHTKTSSTATVTVLSGSGHHSTANSSSSQNATSTATSALPTNTQKCNGYAEFCEKQFSNITFVAAHNSPFVKPGNAASNQVYEVKTQLDNGIRMCRSNLSLPNPPETYQLTNLFRSGDRNPL